MVPNAFVRCANGVVCYALMIAAVNSVGMKLLFLIFSCPDIDLDLPSGWDQAPQ